MQVMKPLFCEPATSPLSRVSNNPGSSCCEAKARTAPMASTPVMAALRPLAADVPHDNEDRAIVLLEDLVEVPADFRRRKIGGFDVEACQARKIQSHERAARETPGSDDRREWRKVEAKQLGNPTVAGLAFVAVSRVRVRRR